MQWDVVIESVGDVQERDREGMREEKEEVEVSLDTQPEGRRHRATEQM